MQAGKNSHIVPQKHLRREEISGENAVRHGIFAPSILPLGVLAAQRFFLYFFTEVQVYQQQYIWDSTHLHELASVGEHERCTIVSFSGILTVTGFIFSSGYPSLLLLFTSSKHTGSHQLLLFQPLVFIIVQPHMNSNHTTSFPRKEI